MITDMDLELSTEVDPPLEPKRKDKKWRRYPRKGALTKRGPPRPYKRIADEVLNSRIKKLTTRVETAKQKHEEACNLLVRYTHERHFRLKDTLNQDASKTEPEKPATEPEKTTTEQEPTTTSTTEPEAASTI